MGFPSALSSNSAVTKADFANAPTPICFNATGKWILLTFAFAYVYDSYDFNRMYPNIGAGDYINAKVDSYDLTFFEHNMNRDNNILTTKYFSENGFLPIFYYGNYEVKKNGELLDYVNKEGLLYIDELDDVERIIQEAMENAAHLRVLLEVDMKKGNNWLEAH